MCHALLHSSTLSRALAASLLLCLYVSVVLLSFTHSKNPPLTSAQAEALAAAHSRSSGGDRTYVTAIWAEQQLPALIALAHSLMQTRSEFGLLLLLPTGAPASDRGAAQSSRSKRIRRATVTTRRKRKKGDNSGAHDAEADATGDDDAAAGAAGSSSSSGEVHAWSEDSLAVLRAIPNLTLQLLPHVRFPPPQPQADTRVLASEGSFSTTQAAQADVSFTSAVRTLLLFEVWRLTDYKQVLYLDVNCIVQRNIDHLLHAQTIEAVPLGAALAKQRSSSGSAGSSSRKRRKKQPLKTLAKDATTSESAATITTLSASPASALAAAAAEDADDASDEAARRAEVVDAGLERWLHAHSMHEAHLPTPAPDAGSTSPSLAASDASHSFHAHLASIDWADAVAHSTPAYLQLAAPMQLASEDCQRFDAVAAQCARDFDAETATHDHSPAAVAAAAASADGASKPPTLEAFSLAGHAALLSPSLAWSLFNSNLLLLSPNAYTYHLLLQSYTHTHVERRDRFDPRHFEHRLDRIKYGNYPAKILNHFFARPCAASSSGTGHASAAAAESPLSAPTAGCWHPLRLNLSLTSHTCGCLGGSAQSPETQPVLRYTACATPGRLNPWTLLASGVAHTLRECDQLTIQTSATGGGAGEAESEDRVAPVAAAAAAAAIDPLASASSLPAGSASAAPADGSGSYYSALLSSLSWLWGSSAERASHRFAEMYLREQEAKAMEAMEAAAAAPGGNRTTGASSSVADEDQLSPCCHAQYGRVLQTYFAALRFIRPNFDEPALQQQQSKRKGGGKTKRRGG